MPEPDITVEVRQLRGGGAVLDIDGQITSLAERQLMEAHADASRDGAVHLLLDFSDLTYMNSSGIGLLITMLVRSQRNRQTLAAFGLSEHYREIFELTRLNEAITIYTDETEAVNALASGAR